jgi:hypothetical protein
MESLHSWVIVRFGEVVRELSLADARQTAVRLREKLSSEETRERLWRADDITMNGWLNM